MRMSRLCFQTLREAPKEAETASHQLMIRSSLIRQVAAGVYEFLPLGWRAALKVTAIIREEMDRAGAQEVLLPQLTPKELWEETGRWNQYGKELMRLKDRHDREFALGPTHEEIITDLVRATLRSYRRLPVTLYQIQTKFRDEIRPRFGVMRAREFLMKDAYSFDADEAGAERSYEAMRVAYNRIFTRLGLTYRMVEAETGLIGGSFSHEFMVLADTGEEGLVTCSACDYAASLEKLRGAKSGDTCPRCAGMLSVIRSIEVGHIFKLGLKYSQAMHAVFLDEAGKEREMWMGCYGIGVTRIVAAAIEQNHDERGIIWPLAIAPYRVIILPLGKDSEATQAAEKLYDEFTTAGIETLLDDRGDTPGVKFADADLLGIPWQIIVGKTYKNEKLVELKRRGKKDGLNIKLEDVKGRVVVC